MDNQTNFVMLKLKDVINICKISKAEIYRKIKKGKFPKQHNQGTRAVAWSSDEIDNFLKEITT